MLLTVTRLSLSHAGLPSQSVGVRVWGTPTEPPEANVKDVYGFPWPPRVVCVCLLLQDL
jgi:hypothetical protein